MTLELSCQAIILVVGQVWIGNQFLQMRVESHSCSPGNGPSPLTGLMGKLPLDKQKLLFYRCYQQCKQELLSQTCEFSGKQTERFTIFNF